MIKAIYHLETKIISRGTGRSAVAASAYMSCSEIYNDYDGITHDYTRKGGLKYERVFLPEFAPPEFKDRSVLWNAVEETEKTKDNRLAREFVIALPIEFTLDEQIKQIEEFTKSLVADGMCADVCIHDTDGHNPHAHIMVTVRPINKDGTWQKKTEKEYLCIKDEREKGFTSSEFSSAKNDGWEKQYQYLVKGKKEYLPMSQANGYERVNKYPKSTRYGRQNPISERWNSEEQLLEWRKLWADIVNRELERKSLEERIDHRSFVARGITEQPTIHEGVASKAMKKKGFKSERSYINFLIRKDNELIRSLKKTIKTLTEAVKNLIPNIAEALETLRINMIKLNFNLETVKDTRERQEYIIKNRGGYIESFDIVAKEIAEKEALLKKSKKKIKLIPKAASKTYNSLRCDIESLIFQLDELKNEQKRYLLELGAENISDAMENLESRKANIPKLKNEESKLGAEFENTLSAYKETEKKVKDSDKQELAEEREYIRPQKEADARKELDVYATDNREWRFNRSIDKVSRLIGEKEPRYKTRLTIRQEKEYEEWLKAKAERQKYFEERRKSKNENDLKDRKNLGIDR